MKKWLKSLIPPAILMLINVWCSGQKYDFVNFTIEHGLVQSQVNNIVQDQAGMLWISTLGGLSRFDGKEFYNYNYGKGLLHSLTEQVYVDHHNVIWIGSSDGVQSFDGLTFKSYEIKSESQRKGVSQICQASDHSLYLLLNDHRLYKLDILASTFKPFSDSLTKITAITTDADYIYAAVYKKGIYKFNQGTWKPIVQWHQSDTTLNIRQLVRSRYHHGIWGVATSKLFWIENDILSEIPAGISTVILTIEESSPRSLYIGTLKGAYSWTRDQPAKYLGLNQGLTDNAINAIFTDKEGNTWFGSNGNGIFRFHDRSFTIYDQSTGLHGNVVMSLVKDPVQDAVWAGTLEGGLNKIQNGSISRLGNTITDKINCLTFSRDGVLWIGTIDNGLWTYDHTGFKQVGKYVEQFPHSFTSIEELSDGKIWITGPRGFVTINKNDINLSRDIKTPCFSVFELNSDSILIGSSNGLYLVHPDLSAAKMSIAGTDGFLIGNIIPWKNYIIFGTSENGLIFWNRQSRKSFICNEKDGLTSNMVFSILEDGDAIYTGTINGLNRITVIPGGDTSIRFMVTPITSSNQKLGPECNQNSILKDQEGKIWLGTTNGIYQYDPKQAIAFARPGIYLKSIDIFSKPVDSTYGLDSLQAWVHFPTHLTLKHSQNHLTFQVGGLQLSAPEKIRYQYALIGADTTYTAASATATVIYPNLAPGNYTFKAKALIEAHPTLYSDELLYSFIINPPFYQKNWFRLLLIITLLAIGALIQKFRIIQKNKQERLVEEVRMQEQIKIQQRTSEDLHDDLGNKITRLALLTDILQTKIQEDEDQHKLLGQIRENIHGLYMGTKDIIWALAPNHNSLSDAIQRIINFGSELFQDSAIHFKSGEIDPSFKALKPPFEFSRNLIMISKEALHNILKHSNAEHASIEFSYPATTQDDPGIMKIEINDDGTGLNAIQTNLSGNGLDNMKKRIERIGGTIQFLPNSPQGTRILFQAKIPQSAG